MPLVILDKLELAYGHWPLDNVVTQAIACEGEGRLIEIAGGYADW